MNMIGFKSIQKTCPWFEVVRSSAGPNFDFKSCIAIGKECCMENCAPLHFVQNGVGKIIYDKLKGSGD